MVDKSHLIVFMKHLPCFKHYVLGIYPGTEQKVLLSILPFCRGERFKVSSDRVSGIKKIGYTATGGGTSECLSEKLTFEFVTRRVLVSYGKSAWWSSLQSFILKRANRKRDLWG